MSVNLKNEAASKKLPLHLVPPALAEGASLAFADGAAKYEPYNWRDAGASVSVYYAAALRHLQAYWDGEDISADARISHLSHVAACMAILLDAERAGVLIDDRPKAVKTKIPEQEDSASKLSSNIKKEAHIRSAVAKSYINNRITDHILNGGDT